VRSVRIAISLAGLIATLLFVHLRSYGEAVMLRQSLEEFPSVVGSWRGQEVTLLESEAVNALKVSDYLMRRYVDTAGYSAWVYIGYWRSQGRDGGQPHSPRNCLPGSGWNPLEASIVNLTVKGGGTLPLNRLVIQKDAQQQVVLYWYRAQGVDVASEVSAKVAMVRSAIVHNRTDGALVRVSSPVVGTVAETSERLLAYVAAMYPELDRFLPS
jgi:EpsI family protein